MDSTAIDFRRLIYFGNTYTIYCIIYIYIYIYTDSAQSVNSCSGYTRNIIHRILSGEKERERDCIVSRKQRIRINTGDARPLPVSSSRFSSNSCYCNMYRLLLSEGPFQSDALLVPEGCLFDHLHNQTKCWESHR